MNNVGANATAGVLPWEADATAMNWAFSDDSQWMGKGVVAASKVTRAKMLVQQHSNRRLFSLFENWIDTRYRCVK